MKTVKLIRTVQTETETIGVFFTDGFQCMTLERPWLNNQPDKSCIPEGTYVVKRDLTGKQRYYAVTDVPGRTYIEIHNVRFVTGLLGCIALAEAIGLVDGRLSAIDSEFACDRFLQFMGDETFALVIENLVRRNNYEIKI